MKISRRPNARLIRRARQKKFLTQEGLAEAAGLGLRTVQRVESGESVSAGSIRAIANALDVEPGRLTAVKLSPIHWTALTAVVLIGAILFAVNTSGERGEVVLHGPRESDALPEDFDDAMRSMSTVVHKPLEGTKEYVGDDWQVRIAIHLGEFKFEMQDDTHTSDAYLALATYRVEDITMVSAGLIRRHISDDGDHMGYGYKHIPGASISPKARQPVTMMIDRMNLGTEFFLQFVVGWVNYDHVDQFTIHFDDGRTAAASAEEYPYFLGILKQVPISESTRDTQWVGLDRIIARDATGAIIGR